jgi:hypothetical protein
MHPAQVPKSNVPESFISLFDFRPHLMEIFHVSDREERDRLLKKSYGNFPEQSRFRFEMRMDFEIILQFFNKHGYDVDFSRIQDQLLIPLEKLQSIYVRFQPSPHELAVQYIENPDSLDRFDRDRIIFEAERETYWWLRKRLHPQDDLLVEFRDEHQIKENYHRILL